ncbi:phosphorylase [Sphaerospermopsis sp. LEGE 00249]|uniref:5'-methylthioadenosine/S-adenosylhomocysteine nucleosidase family protein n=1 Tax=Sphaerospermopsis sp. LEGE 00249 TaxID=1380707 RepID=UPI00164CF09D|nr:phosphorylase [Sphaerospermopsis sp. LEGE 00249]MBC5794698.1 phosphorylase [Sphaerospermopsis sp. LEGE 00249]
MINTILVPQGAENQAVCRGLSRVKGLQPQVIAIPLGMKSLYQFLEKNCQHLNQLNQRVLLMGLCGSLNEHYKVGDIVLYRDCMYQRNLQKCDRTLITEIYNQLGDTVAFVQGLTSDRVISLAAEKQNLHLQSGADVVDMEGFTFLEFFQPLGISTAILRVVSDDTLYDIPDLTTAISADGSLQPLPLALTFIRKPLAATRLIRSSLQALKILETVAYCLASSSTRI